MNTRSINGPAILVVVSNVPTANQGYFPNDNTAASLGTALTSALDYAATNAPAEVIVYTGLAMTCTVS